MRSASLPSGAEGKGAAGRRAEPPGATRSPAWGEHGEDGEHDACPFPGVSTAASSAHDRAG